MPFIRANDLIVNYDLAGAPSAAVVVLANALGTSLALWDAQHDAFAASYRVLRYDMRGHGLTSGAGSVVTIAGLAADLAALLDALAIERVAIVGLSIGGMMAQAFAAAYPERTLALALCATASNIGPASVWDTRIAAIEAGGMAAIVDGVLARWFSPQMHSDRPDVVAGFGTMVSRTPAEAYIACCKAIRATDLSAGNASIAAPVLVISGGQDAVTSPAAGACLQSEIRGAHMITLPDAAHILCVESADKCTAALLAFLAPTLQTAAR